MQNPRASRQGRVRCYGVLGVGGCPVRRTAFARGPPLRLQQGSQLRFPPLSGISIFLSPHSSVSFSRWAVVRLPPLSRLDHEPHAAGVLQLDPAPGTDSVGVLRPLAIGLDLDRTGIVLGVIVGERVGPVVAEVGQVATFARQRLPLRNMIRTIVVAFFQPECSLRRLGQRRSVAGLSLPTVRRGWARQLL